MTSGLTSAAASGRDVGPDWENAIMVDDQTTSGRFIGRTVG
jgi:hypothetical protein